MTDAERVTIVRAAHACPYCASRDRGTCRQTRALINAHAGCNACAIALFAAVERAVADEVREACALAVWNTFVEAPALPQVQKALDDSRTAFMTAIRTTKETP